LDSSDPVRPAVPAAAAERELMLLDAAGVEKRI
jgi:hypothetical protein